jgi:molybdenum cofactor guanylyltransferase
MDAAAVTGLILAGGKSTRMGGLAKGLLELHGEPLIARVIERLRPQVGALLLSANAPDYDACGLATVADMLPDHPGPLAGLLTGLRACATPWLVTAPCDAPFLPDDLVMRLAAAAYPVRGISSRQRRLFVARSPNGIEPGFVLCHAGLADDLERWLRQGGRKVRDWLAAAGAVEVAFDSAADFANINTPEELARWQKMANRS